MSHSIEIVAELFGELSLPGGRFDAVVWLADPDMTEARHRLIAPDAPIDFRTPDGGMLGDMSGPFAGPAGFERGWREWLRPWERFEIFIDEIEESGGRLLLLSRSIGHMKGIGVEVETPVAALYTIRDDLIVAIELFLDQGQARRAFER